MEDHLTPPIELGEEISPNQQNQQSKQQFNIKLNCRGQLRRLQLQECSFRALQKAIKALFPDFQGGKYFYQDDEGDKIVFYTDAEVSTMFGYFKGKWNCDTPRVLIEENERTTANDVAEPMLLDEIDYFRHAQKQLQQGNGNSGTDTSINLNDANVQDNNKPLHPNIICDLCDGPVHGHRFKCLICFDYDLCEACERTGHHGEHAMLRLATLETEKPSFLRPSILSGIPRFMGPFAHSSRCRPLLNHGQEYRFEPESEQAKKPMNYEEKRAISLAITRLPSHELKNIIDIVIKSEEIADSREIREEIDLDFEKMKPTTLRQLEAFVKAKDTASAQSGNGQFPPFHHRSRHHHGPKHSHHRHHSSKWANSGMNRNHWEGAMTSNVDEQQNNGMDEFNIMAQKLAEKQQKWIDKMDKKCAKQEQHYRDRAFRALHRFDHHRHGHSGHGQHSQNSPNQQFGGEQQQQPNSGNKKNPSEGGPRNGVEYLKQFGHSIQKALLNFGIDCEATVKDRQGNVQAHLPFPVNENGGENQAKQNEENRLNPMERQSPAGVLERQKLASKAILPTKHGIGKKKCAKEIKLAELREAIQRADQIVNEKTLRKIADAGVEKDKKKSKMEKNGENNKTLTSKLPTPPPTAESQSPSSEQQNIHPPIDPSLQAVLQNATKAAMDGLQVASQIASEIISGFDPAAGEHINRLGQNLVDEAKSGAKNLTDKLISSPELFQRANSFQSYLEQLQFPQPHQNPTQNAQPLNGNVEGQGQQFGNFPPSPQMSEQIQELMAQIQNQVQNWRQMATEMKQANSNTHENVNTLPVEENPKKEDEKNSTKEEETPEQKKLTRNFNQMKLNESAVENENDEEKDNNIKEKEDEKTIDENDQEVNNENDEQIVGGRKKMESFSSSDSDVEILNGSEDGDEDAVDEGNNLENEPSLPPSFGSGHSSGSLKRKASTMEHNLEMNKALYDSVNMDMELSTHTALSSSFGGMSAGEGNGTTVEGEHKKEKDGNEVLTNNNNNSSLHSRQHNLSGSRSSSISSLHSASSDSTSSSDSSGWMVVKKESFKRLCDFYEKRRRFDSPNGHGDSFIAELEKERQEALKQQEEGGEGVDENVDKSKNSAEILNQLLNPMGPKEEEQNQQANRNEEISVDLDVKKMQINEEVSKKPTIQSTIQKQEVEEERIVDIVGKSSNNLPNKNGIVAQSSAPHQPFNNSNHPNANPLLANIGANFAGLLDVLMRGGGGEHHQTSAPIQPNQSTVPPFKWNWGAIPMPPPPSHRRDPNFMEIPVFENNEQNQAKMKGESSPKPLPSAPAEEINGNGGGRVRSNIYPDLLAASVNAGGNNGVLDELCTAGESPHPQCLKMATTSLHSRKCRWIHPVPKVFEVVEQFVDMGFDNCNGWLYLLAEQNNCDMERIFEAIEKDQVHKERQMLADN